MEQRETQVLLLHVFEVLLELVLSNLHALVTLAVVLARASANATSIIVYSYQLIIVKQVDMNMQVVLLQLLTPSKLFSTCPV